MRSRPALGLSTRAGGTPFRSSRTPLCNPSPFRRTSFMSRSIELRTRNRLESRGFRYFLVHQGIGASEGN